MMKMKKISKKITELSERIQFLEQELEHQKTINIEKERIIKQCKSEDHNYKAVLEQSGDGIVITDNEGRIEFWNESMFKITGFRESEVLDICIWDIQLQLIPKELRTNDLLDQLRNSFHVIVNSDSQFINAREQKIINRKGKEIVLQDSTFLIKGRKNKLGAILRDITEQKKVEEFLKRSRENLHITLQSIGDGVIVTDENGFVSNMNPVAEELCGWKLKKAIGRHLPEVFHIVNAKTGKKKLINPVTKVLKTKRSAGKTNHTILISKNGWEYHISHSASPIKGTSGEIFGVVLVFSDISEQYAQEEALIESERSKSILLSNIPGIAYRCAFDKDWTMEFISEGIYEISGYKEKDILLNSKISFNQLIAPEYQEKIWNLWVDVVKKKKKFLFEYEIITKSGQRKWVWEQGVPIFDSKGNTVALEGLIIDISQRKKSEEELRIFMEATLNSSDAIGISKPDGKHYYENIAFTKLFGNNTGDSPSETIFVDKELGRHIFNQIKKGEKWEGEVKMYNAQNSIIDVLLRAYAAKNSEGEITALVGVHTDISQQKKSEAQLIEAKERAEKSDKLKSVFLANMSHEIRTPMNGILGFADLLRDNNLSNEEQLEYIDIIQKSGNRLLEIINNLIDISTIEAGLEKIHYDKNTIRNLISDIISFYKTDAKKKGIKLLVNDPSSIQNISLFFDSSKLYSVLSNLVSNAIKYSCGTVLEISFYESNNNIYFSIKDNGIGIPKEWHNSVFNRFIKVEMQDKTQEQGAGLGLSIAKAYTEMMRGQMSLKSKPGKGAAFNFYIPAIKSLAELSTINNLQEIKIKPELLSQKSYNFLIIDNDNTTINLAEIAIKMYSREVNRANDGKQALEIIGQKTNLDIILVDNALPDISGIELAKMIKKDNPSITIILQTEFNNNETKKLALSAGCNYILNKPYKVSDLISILDTHFVNT